MRDLGVYSLTDAIVDAPVGNSNKQYLEVAVKHGYFYLKFV
jgi:hypothetical protein